MKFNLHTVEAEQCGDLQLLNLRLFVVRHDGLLASSGREVINRKSHSSIGY